VLSRRSLASINPFERIKNAAQDKSFELCLKVVDEVK
jgi:hypothetical protein